MNVQLTPDTERPLTAYRSADGNPPSGLDDTVDDGPAINAAIADGAGVIRIPPGYYRWTDVRVPAGVAVVGAPGATLIRTCNDHHPIFDQSGVGHWAIRDLILDGEASEPWRQRRDLGRVGISISDAWAYHLAGVTVRDFSGPGVRVAHTRLIAAAYCDGGMIERLTAVRNTVGICFDERGEYVTLANSQLMHNTVGCVIYAGNTKIVQSNIGSNIDGIRIVDKENGSHGVIANCLINHNEQYALDCHQVLYGMVINACGIFYGTIRLRDSRGVQIANCQVSCHVDIAGEDANAFVNNMIIEEDFTFGLCDACLVRDNFTTAGGWQFNRAYTYSGSSQ